MCLFDYVHHSFAWQRQKSPSEKTLLTKESFEQKLLQFRRIQCDFSFGFKHILLPRGSEPRQEGMNQLR